MRLLLNAYMLKKGVSAESLKSMTDAEVTLYSTVYGILDEVETEQLQQNQLG